MRLIMGLSVAALAISAPATAQRQATPEQRIDRLEKQLRQVQGRVFQRGQPADTAGFDYDPAAPLSSVASLTDRLSALERQLAEMQRLTEENGNRLRSIEGDLARARSEQSDRIAALERRVQELSVAPASAVPNASGASPATSGASTPAATSSAQQKPPVGVTAATPPEDPGEEAYSQGFRLWQAGNYKEAITSLKSFIAAYPNHRRISWANNLIGRSLLDSGNPREAATALLANYRSNPSGERAADSLYYLGQSLMRLGQPVQACSAYAELEAIYGGKMRAELSRLLPEAKAKAQCR